MTTTTSQIAPTPTNNVGEIAKALQLFEGLIELRSIAPGWKGRKETVSGFFDDYSLLAKAANEMADGNVYVTLNPVLPALKARRNNRVDVAGSGETTSDQHIERRRLLLVDLDAKRPSGVSATDAEHEQAVALAKRIAKSMIDESGWPRPVLADSGNGAHLLWRIDLPNDEQSTQLVQSVLRRLDELFSCDAVKVDLTVYNPARISKLYGTVARKGDHTAERPHRLSKLLFVPSPLGIVSRNQLGEFGEVIEPVKPPATRNESPTGSFNAEEFIKSNLTVTTDGPHRDHNSAEHRWKIKTCPFCGESDGSAVVLRYTDGRLGYKCHHDRCVGKGWKELREHFEPGYRERLKQAAPSGSTATTAPPRPGVPDLRPADLREPPEARRARRLKLWKPFPLGELPTDLAEYIGASAAAIGCDPAYVALPVLAVCASAIGNSRRIQLKPGWQEPSVLWAVIIGESGTQKSPAYDAATRPLEKWQGEEFDVHSAALGEYELKKAVYEQEKKRWKGEGYPPEAPREPICLRYIVSDTTVEGLVPVLRDNPRGVLLAREELAGWINSFDKYSGGKQSTDSAAWLSMHGARPVTVDRKTGPRRTLHVPRAAVSVCGTIQPAILNRALGTEHRESGLAARLLLSCPPRSQKRWSEREVSTAVEQRYYDIIGRLFDLEMRADDEGRLQPEVIRLSPQAKEVFKQFVDRHGSESYSLQGDLAAAYSKLEGTAARLSLILALIREESEVTETTAANAIEIAEWFKHEVCRVYSLFHESDEERARRELVELVSRLSDHEKGITPNNLRRRSRRFENSDEAERALNSLVADGLGKWHSPHTGGRPARYFKLVADVSVSLSPSNPDKNTPSGYGYKISDAERQNEWATI